MFSNKKAPGSIPSLDEIARAPTLARDLSSHTRGELIAQCAAALAALSAPIVAEVHAPVGDGGDRLLDVEEAAAKTGLTRNALYRRKDLPFKVRTGPKQVRFSSCGIEHWIRAKTHLA